MKLFFSNIAYTLYTILLVVIGLRLSYAIPYELASIIVSIKIPVLGLYLVILSLVWMIDGGFFYKKIFFSAIIFPVYYMVINIFYKDNPNIQTVLLYYIWYFYIFVLGVTFLNSRIKYKKYLIYTVFGSFIILIWGAYSSITGLVADSHFNGRFSMGYENPNYYAQYWEILFISLVFLYSSMKKSLRLSSLVIMLLCIYFSYLANSRNVMVFFFVFIFWFYTYEINSKIILKLSVLFIAILFFSSFGTEEINELSSGRTSLWFYIIKAMSEKNYLSMIFGAQEAIDTGNMVLRYSRFSEVDSVVKIHADNSYLEIFIESGLLGLGIFSLPYYFVYRALTKCTNSIKRLYFSIYVAFLTQSFFTTTITSFFSPLAMFMGLILIVPYINSISKNYLQEKVH